MGRPAQPERPRDPEPHQEQGAEGEVRRKVVVWGVMPGDPPFRTVQIGESVVGTAHGLADVVQIVVREGMHHVDLDDPSVVRWVGGGKYTWVP